jgi:hypothetical protein
MQRQPRDFDDDRDVPQPPAAAPLCLQSRVHPEPSDRTLPLVRDPRALDAGATDENRQPISGTFSTPSTWEELTPSCYVASLSRP